MINDCLCHAFSPVTLHDIPLLNEYLKLVDYEESNHNIITMFTWMDYYPLYKYLNDDYLILAGIHEGKAFIYMPICKREFYLEAIAKARELFAKCNLKFVLSCATKEYKDLILDNHPDLKMSDIRDGYDYVYELSQFRDFKGKKMQKKRNHLNGFLKAYAGRFEYEDVNENNIEACKDYILSLEADSETLLVERAGIMQILDAYALLDYKAGVIKIDGQIEAFILASKLSPRMIQENVEKANHEFRGLSQALLANFFQRNYLEFEYLNREDDMGIEALRTSKLSYCPTYMIEKYSFEEL